MQSRDRPSRISGHRKSSLAPPLAEDFHRAVRRPSVHDKMFERGVVLAGRDLQHLRIVDTAL
jgi:hypothetical protein